MGKIPWQGYGGVLSPLQWTRPISGEGVGVGEYLMSLVLMSTAVVSCIEEAVNPCQYLTNIVVALVFVALAISTQVSLDETFVLLEHMLK